MKNASDLRKEPSSKMHCSPNSDKAIAPAFIPTLCPFKPRNNTHLRRYRAPRCCQGPSASIPSGLSTSPSSFPRIADPPSTGSTSLRAAVLVSGGGRSLANLCEHVDGGTLRGVEICGVVSSKRKTGANGVAEQYGLGLHVVVAKEYANSDEHSLAVTAALDALRPDVVVMAGWMHFYRIPDKYTGRVINIHPSLIPAFCGKGYYGMRVHSAVVEFGVKVTGCTVHFADNEYDHGPIIHQQVVPVLDGDTAEDVASRVFDAEKEALPKVLSQLAAGQLVVRGRRVVQIHDGVTT